ncbi:response regulator [Daejeonella sp.]|uniref:response regulator n=1 Tax=Daejeonella sp. TaxID=2805397 RepID=UPI0030C26D99
MKMRVLVIDDDQEHLDILDEALSYYHFKVMVCSDGQDLEQVLRSFKPGLLLMDYRLPGDNGVELCKRIKNEFKIYDLPVILMSAYPLGDENLMYCNYLLHKPFDLDTLIEHIDQLLLQYSI